MKRAAYHHGDLRKSLIRNALAIIDQEGIAKLTLRKAARRAGVSHAAPAHHFNDMKGLLAAIAEEGFHEMSLLMENAAGHEKAANPLNTLKAIGMAYIEFAVQHPSYFKIMYYPELSKIQSRFPGLEKESKNAFELLKKCMQECRKSSLIRAEDIRNLSLFAWSTVHGLAVLAVDDLLENKGLNDDIAIYADKLTSLLYLGLKK